MAINLLLTESMFDDVDNVEQIRLDLRFAVDRVILMDQDFSSCEVELGTNLVRVTYCKSEPTHQRYLGKMADLHSFAEVIGMAMAQQLWALDIIPMALIAGDLTRTDLIGYYTANKVMLLGDDRGVIFHVID